MSQPLDPSSQMRLRFGGTISAPLFETPYQVPDVITGYTHFDAQSCEPFIQQFDGTTYTCMVPTPVDYGLNAFKGFGPQNPPPHELHYHGGFTYRIDQYENPLGAGDGGNLFGLNWRLGTVYNVGWRAGLPAFGQNPAGIVTTNLFLNKDNPIHPGYWPDDPQGPTHWCWPSWATYFGPGGLSPHYGDVLATGPLPTSVHSVGTTSETGKYIPEGDFPLLHKNTQCKLAAMVTDYGAEGAGILTEYGATFDTVGIYRQNASADPFLLFMGSFDRPFTTWQAGASLFLNTKGLFVGPSANRGPSVQLYEATPFCQKGMILQNTKGEIIVLGRGIGDQRSGGEGQGTQVPFPVEMVADNTDPLAAYIRNADIHNGYRPTALLPVSLWPGQALTPAVFDPSNGVYYVVRLIPKSDKGVQALSSAGSLGTWEFKFSSGNYFMLTNNSPGIQGQLFHTSGGRLDYDPMRAQANLVSLPCFNPCVPVIIGG